MDNLSIQISALERRITSHKNALNSIEELITAINELIEQDEEYLEELRCDEKYAIQIGLPGYSK